MIGLLPTALRKMQTLLVELLSQIVKAGDLVEVLCVSAQKDRMLSPVPLVYEQLKPLHITDHFRRTSFCPTSGSKPSLVRRLPLDMGYPILPLADQDPDAATVDLAYGPRGQKEAEAHFLEAKYGEAIRRLPESRNIGASHAGMRQS